MSEGAKPTIQFGNITFFRDDTVFKHGELVQAYYHSFQNYGAMDEHYHNFYELNIIIKGRGSHHMHNKIYNIQRGSTFIIPPFIHHSYTFENKDYIIFHILFHDLFFDKYNNLLKNISGFNFLFDIEPYFRLHREYENFLLSLDTNHFTALIPNFKNLDMLEKESTDNTQQKKEFLTLYILSIICENMKNFINASKENNELLFCILKSVEYIQNNYAEKITLSNLCKEVNMSRSSFLRHFKNFYNCTPIEYINDYRVKQSQILLRETDKSIVTVAQDCGFFDSSHFIRYFTKKVALTPVKYREIIRKEKQ